MTTIGTGFSGVFQGKVAFPHESKGFEHTNDKIIGSDGALFVLFLRTVIVYIFVVLAIRIMGKRQLGELQPNELVVTIIISNIATLSLQDNGLPILGTILPIFTLVGCEVIISWVALKSVGVRRMVAGNPRIIIRDGLVDQLVMKSLRWTIDDLLEQLRVKDIFDITEISMAVVETSGSLSVYSKYPYRPLTPRAAGIQPPGPNADSPPVVLVSDGSVSQDGLRFCGVDRNWLNRILEKDGCTLGGVFLMTCDRNLSYHIIRKEKRKA
jgi:uncharacterized membrane protein YcaP (DUF421 family)